MLLANFNGKEHLRHRAVSLRQHGFLVLWRNAIRSEDYAAAWCLSVKLRQSDKTAKHTVWLSTSNSYVTVNFVAHLQGGPKKLSCRLLSISSPNLQIIHRMSRWKKLWKLVNIWQRYGQKFAADFFVPPHIYAVLIASILYFLLPIRNRSRMHARYWCGNSVRPYLLTCLTIRHPLLAYGYSYIASCVRPG